MNVIANRPVALVVGVLLHEPGDFELVEMMRVSRTCCRHLFFFFRFQERIKWDCRERERAIFMLHVLSIDDKFAAGQYD